MEISEDEWAERVRLYAETRDDLLTRNLSNSENMDKAILSLSSALLGLSLGLIQNVVSLKTAVYVPLLLVSWWLFAAAIILTLLSFLSSQWGINRQLELTEAYYLKWDDGAFNGPNFWAKTTTWFNGFSAMAFIAAVISTIVFISKNL